MICVFLFIINYHTFRYDPNITCAWHVELIHRISYQDWDTVFGYIRVMVLTTVPHPPPTNYIYQRWVMPVLTDDCWKYNNNDIFDDPRHRCTGASLFLLAFSLSLSLWISISIFPSISCSFSKPMTILRKGIHKFQDDKPSMKWTQFVRLFVCCCCLLASMVWLLLSYAFFLFCFVNSTKVSMLIKWSKFKAKYTHSTIKNQTKPNQTTPYNLNILHTSQSRVGFQFGVFKSVYERLRLREVALFRIPAKKIYCRF